MIVKQPHLPNKKYDMFHPENHDFTAHKIENIEELFFGKNLDFTSIWITERDLKDIPMKKIDH